MFISRLEKTKIGLLFIPACILAFALSSPASAQTGAEGITTVLEEVVVVGTRRKGRTVADSTVPIDVIGADQLENSGFTETNRLLSNLLPSFNFPQPSITDATDQIRPAQLRGLAPDQTLVLINGKRRHKSSLINLNGSVGRGSQAVDINQIPANSIKSIQVLRDGAAAQYGSDAIAGVINIILKDAPDGLSFSTIYGEYRTELDDVSRVGSVTAVLDDMGSETLQVTPSDRDDERDDGGVLTVRGNLGLPFFGDGFLNASFEYRDRDDSNRAGYDPRQQYALIPGGTDGCTNTVNCLDPREFTFDRINHRFGNAEVEDSTFVVNAGKPLTADLEAYLFATYGHREGNSGGFYRRSQDARNVPEIYPHGFLPQITTETDDMSFVVGVRGDVIGWDSDFSLVYGENDIEFGVVNSLNASYGPVSPTEFDIGSLINDHLVLNVDFSRLYDFNNVPVNMAFGFEYREENYELGAGEPASLPTGAGIGPVADKAAGAQVLPGFTPESEVNGERDNIGVYLELDADITDRWNLGVAGRFEDYSDFGSDFNWKLATRFGVSDTFNLRGSVQTGLRAPSLGQQYYQSIATVFVDAIPSETGTFRPTSDVAIALGSPGLDAETSFGFSAGFTWELIDGFNLTVDYYSIDIDDRIVLSENLRSAAVVEVLEAAGVNATRARFFLNGADTETRGYDVVATYDWNIGEGGGVIKFNVAYNDTETEVDVIKVPLAVNLEADGIFSSREARRLEIGSPETKLNLGATWLYQDLQLTLRLNRYGETVDPQSNIAEDEVIDAEWITDIEVHYDFSEMISLAVGANNVFDVYPEATISFNERNGIELSTFDRIFPYSGFSPYGFSGRFVYGRVGLNF